jgi:small GTP-binding protein
MLVDGKPYNLGLWDTAGQDDYDRLRPLSYPQTDVFLVMFSVVNPVSFANVVSKWIPEIKHYCPETPFILVGAKSDLRTNPAALERLQDMGKSAVPREDAEKAAREYGAARYIECSALTQENLKDVFVEAVRVGTGPKSHKGKKSSKSKCSIL